MPDLSPSVWSSAVILLFVMDPVGNIPPILALLRDLPPRRRRLVILRELFIALGVLLGFLFFGQAILDFLDLQQESVAIAGGIVLLIIALRMIFPSREGLMGPLPEGEPLIVPLAVPMIAGPSSMATLILMVRSDPGHLGIWLVALLLAWSVTAVLLLLAPVLYRLLRERGLLAMERLMGMLLIMIAVQMVLNGVRSVLA